MLDHARPIPAVCGLLLLLGGSAAGAGPGPHVVVSIAPLHSLVAGIMAGIGRPTLIVSAGRSPHTYQMRPSEATRIAAADLVVWVGAPLEPFLKRPLANLGHARAVALLDLPGLTLYRVRASGTWRPGAAPAPAAPAGARPETIDPHAWLDPENARRFVAEIARRLGAIDEQHAPRYRANAAALSRRLDALDRHLAARLRPVRTIPYAVLHDAFQYLERRYRLASVGAAVASPDRPPSAKRLAALRRVLVREGVHCLFHEPQFESPLVKMLAAGTAVKRASIDPLGAAYPPGPDAYFEMMTATADAIAGCLAP